MKKIKCSIVRGGTSKGIFINGADLPQGEVERRQIILDVFGSPDFRQIDGLGGADSLTSKLAIIDKSTREDADVDYTFGQVSITENFIDYGGNCGNISSGVGVYAIEKGFVKGIAPFTEVKIHLTNCGRILKEYVPVENGKVKVEGDYKIDGVPGTAARLDLDWSKVVGSITGNLLPTGKSQEEIKVSGKTYRISVIDAGNIVIFARAEDFGLQGTETPLEIDLKKGLLDEIEMVRGHVCKTLNLVKTWEEAKITTPYQPFFAMVSEAQRYICFDGNIVEKEEIDFVSRLVFMLRMHKTYPITGTVATAVASKIPNTIVWDLLDEKRKAAEIVKIGHPAGVIEAEVLLKIKEHEIECKKLMVSRTARIIMDGEVYLKGGLR